MPSPESHRLWYAAGALFGYLLLMLSNPVRASLRDGLRCIRRYPGIWALLFLFGCCYAVFSVGLEVFLNRVLPEGQRPLFIWSRAWFLPPSMQMRVLHESWLPALENVAGIFNNIVTTFPCSAIAAILLLVNWQGHHAVLLRALRHRFNAWGWFAYFAISLCATAAILKPLLYGPSLPALANAFPQSGIFLLHLAFIIDWLSFIFEYLFGVYIQIYLILLVYVWIRGLTYTSRHLVDFALRRSSFVLKWATLVILLSSILIHLPIILSSFPLFAGIFPPEGTIDYTNRVARPLLSVFLILFSTVQITLTFHSESLRRALRDHLLFIKRNAWPFAWFILIAAIHFFVLAAVNLSLVRGFGERTAIIVAWRLIYPFFGAIVSAWLLSAWVCLFKRCETGRAHPEDWIKF